MKSRIRPSPPPALHMGVAGSFDFDLAGEVVASTLSIQNDLVVGARLVETVDSNPLTEPLFDKVSDGSRVWDLATDDLVVAWVIGMVHCFDPPCFIFPRAEAISKPLKIRQTRTE